MGKRRRRSEFNRRWVSAPLIFFRKVSARKGRMCYVRAVQIGMMVLNCVFCPSLGHAAGLSREVGQHGSTATIRLRQVQPLGVASGLHVESVQLDRALEALSQITGIPIVFSPTLLPDKVVTCRCTSISVRETLEILLRGTGLEFTANAGQVVILGQEDVQSRLEALSSVRPSLITRATDKEEAMLRTMRSALGVISAGVVASASIGSTPAVAQQANIRGQVVDQATLRPLPAVQVFIQGSSSGTLTDARGNYIMVTVPPGTHTIQAQLVGYAPARVTLEVAPGASIQQNFQLETQAISLDEVVATGTGAPARRRQLGQTINSVTGDELTLAPVTNVQEILQGRIPGVTAGTVGETGAAAQIILRGTSSLSQRNEPLIYVDGIRMNNSRSAVAGTSTNRLGDINPADIERVEVIKGAAAATLFGTEASSGVIQIFTKRGVALDPVFTFQMDQQLIQIPNSKWPINAQYHPTLQQVVTNRPAETLVDMGNHQNYNLSVRGGSGPVQYFVSGRLMDEDSPMPNNGMSNASLRSAFDVAYGSRLRATVDLGWVNNTLEVPQPDWSSTASDFLLSQPIRATEQFPYGRSGCQCWDIPDILKFTYSENTKNILLASSLNYTFHENVIGSLRVGYNDISLKGVAFRPEGITPPGEFLSRGYRRVETGDNTSTTLDANINWQANFGPRLQSSFTAGGQSFWEGRTRQSASVQDFASPTLETLRGGSNITGIDEYQEQVINAGVFVQEQIGIDDRLFVTGGLRMDGNSAFGENFGFSFYPKVGLSWVLSEYDFFNLPMVEELRFRGAWGTSGLQPGAFDAQRTWAPRTFAGNVPMVAPLNLGNADLKPERSTEWELALEAGLLDGRVGLEAIYFNQVTSDALLPQAPPPSGGFTRPQLVNIGEMTSEGVELSSTVRIIDGRSFGWTAQGSYTWLNQLVTDMGGVPDFRITSRRRYNWIAEGYSPGKVIAPIQDPDQPFILRVPVEQLTTLAQIEPNVIRDENGLEKNFVIGNALPTYTLSFGSDFRLGQNLSLRALFIGAGGFVMSNETEIIRSTSRINPWTANMEAILRNPASTVEERRAVAEEYGRKHPAVISSHMEDGDWIKLNEVSLNYQLPNNWTAPLGLQQSSVTFGGRNLHLWTGYSGMLDPGTTSRVDGVESNFLQNIDYISTPSPIRYTFSFRTSW